MAISKVSPADQDPVRTALKRPQDVMRRYSARAHYPNYPNVRRVTEATDAGQICCAVSAPVAQKGNDLWLKILQFHFFSSNGKFNLRQNAKAQSLDLLFLFFSFACLAALREHIVIAIADD